MASSTPVPVTITSAGAQPTSPAALRALLVETVSAVNPGYTDNLPASMVEDQVSTGTYSLAQMDTARVEAINSVAPNAANAWLAYQLGQVYIGPGAAPAPPTNTSVYVVFSGPEGYVIPVGFTVGDGVYQYIVQDGGVVGSGGDSDPLYCVSPTVGQWSVPAGTVTNVVTSVPSSVDPPITCINPQAGLSSQVAETQEQFTTRVMLAGLASSTGLASMVKTLVEQVPGVQSRLVAARVQPANGLWEIIVGGGDPYEVAGAINNSGVNIAGLTGSILAITNITQANPGVVTTDLNHGYQTGDTTTPSAIVGMTPLNGMLLTVTVISEKVFSIGIDTTGYPAYVSGGVLDPNPRNELVSLSDPPDVYGVTFVVAPEQSVTMLVEWQTTEPNFVSQAAVASLAAPAISEYVNSILVGQPMSLVALETTFAEAVDSVLDVATIDILDFTVSINGIATPPSSGSQLIVGDPESYFATVPSFIVVIPHP